jgi:PIN domain nuclease of toxin-antitoxin system
MQLLLDTNAFVWLLDNNANLGLKARRVIDDAENVYVSCASILELTIKSMLGKIEIPESLANDAKTTGLKIIDFKIDHVLNLQLFPDLVRHDPFDRMILATAKSENFKLLTSDKFIISLNLDYVINAKL